MRIWTAMLHLTKKAIKLWQCIMNCYQHKYCLGRYLNMQHITYNQPRPQSLFGALWTSWMRAWNTRGKRPAVVPTHRLGLVTRLTYNDEVIRQPNILCLHVFFSDWRQDFTNFNNTHFHVPYCTLFYNPGKNIWRLFANFTKIHYKVLKSHISA